MAFLSNIKRVLDGLEQCKYLFITNKVPCMHMCIWAVTSVLKIFENSPELFIDAKGPPPPPSDSEDDESLESDLEEDSSR